MSFQDAISIAGLYLALVGLLSTFFFVQLGQWLNSILATEAKWLQVAEREPMSQFFDKRLECYYEAVQSSSWWTLVGWFAITVFLVTVGVFLEILRSHLGASNAAIVYMYVSVPCYIFLSIYLVLSIAMLVIGYQKSREVVSNAKKELTR